MKRIEAPAYSLRCDGCMTPIPDENGDVLVYTHSATIADEDEDLKDLGWVRGTDDRMIFCPSCKQKPENTEWVMG